MVLEMAVETPQDVEAMQRLSAAGWGRRRIARELGCSPETVRKFFLPSPRSAERCMGGPHNIPSGQSRFCISCLNRFALMPEIDSTARLLKDGAVPAKHDGRSA
jgi:hypothetical protein